MSRLKKILLFSVAGVPLSGLLFLQGCMDFRSSDEKTIAYFDKRKVPVRIHYKEFEGQTIRYIESGREEKSRPMILFVHGAPGSADNFYRYMADSALLAKARMVSVDRLGYGFSEYGRSVTSIARQARQLRFVLEQYQADKAILAGHSYGGPIAARCAMDYPGLVDGILLLAPAIDPEQEKIFWFSKFGQWKLTRWLLPPSFRVSADEKFTHIAELEEMEPGWDTLNIPVVHMHGNRDRIVPYGNVDFIQQWVKEECLKVVPLPKANHFIPWNREKEVKEELMGLLENR